MKTRSIKTHDANTQSVKPFKASRKSLIAINAKLGYAAILLITGLWMWPERLIDYGWGLLAFLLIASALALTINAIQQIIKRESFIREQEEFQALGNEVKSSQFTSDLPIKKGFKVK